MKPPAPALTKKVYKMRLLLLIAVSVAVAGCAPITKGQCLALDQSGQALPEQCLELRSFPAGAPLGLSLSITYEDRMRAANLNFTAGCLLTAIDLCSQMNDNFPARNHCYDKMQATCSTAANNYETWLRAGKS